MNIHVLQHVPFEDEGRIGVWAREKDHPLSRTRLYAGDNLPPLDDFDLLVVMGGPMNIYEEAEYPWLTSEKRFIRAAIDAGKKVLGICLGAQLIADVLGAKVFKNREKEIGWLPVDLLKEAKISPLFRSLPESFTPFHWHGDTFSLPVGALHIARSKGCEHQAFEYGGRIVGLQFHLETTEEGMERLIEHCGDEIRERIYIQTAGEMRREPERFEQTGKLLDLLLENLEKAEG